MAKAWLILRLDVELDSLLEMLSRRGVGAESRRIVLAESEREGPRHSRREADGGMFDVEREKFS